MRLDWFIIRLISPYESSAPRHFRMRCVNFHFSNCYRYFLFRSRNSLAAFTCEYQIREVDRPVRLGYLVRVECSIGAHFNEKKNKINNVSPSKSKVAKRERERKTRLLLHVYTRHKWQTFVRLDYTRFARCPFITARTSSLHTCAMLVFHSSSHNRMAETRRWSLSPACPRNLNISLDFLFALVPADGSWIVYADRSFSPLLLSILSR